jgi:hypothetical protein
MMKSKNKTSAKRENRVPENEHLEDFAGYDRNFDPIAEACDLKIVAKREAEAEKKHSL